MGLWYYHSLTWSTAWKIIKAFGRKRTWSICDLEMIITKEATEKLFRWLTGCIAWCLRHTFFRGTAVVLLCKQRAAHLATCGLTRAVKPLQGAQVAKRYQIEIESDLLLIDTYKNFKHWKFDKKKSFFDVASVASNDLNFRAKILHYW